MRHTVMHWHGLVLHDVQYLAPAFVIIAVMVAFLIPMFIREGNRAAEAQEGATR